MFIVGICFVTCDTDGIKNVITKHSVSVIQAASRQRLSLIQSPCSICGRPRSLTPSTFLLYDVDLQSGLPSWKPGLI